MSGKNNCQNRREAIAAFMLGELGTEAAEELQKHIDGCESCRSFYQALAEEEEVIESAFRAISDKSESMQDSLVEQFEKHPATLREQMRPRRGIAAILSAIMRSKVTRFAAAAVIVIVAVLGAHRLVGPIDGATVALGQVVQNMKAMPWMCMVSEQEEHWVAFESKVWAWKYADGSVVFSDYGKHESYRYAPTSQTITVTYLHEEKLPVEFSSAFSVVDSLLEETIQQGGKITREAGEYEGNAVDVYNMSVGGNGVTVGLQLHVDRESHLAIAGVIVFYMRNGFAAGNIEFEYPEDGPKDIYALGVPVTAKVIYKGAESDVQLATELKQVEAMFAAADIEGLVAMLSEAKFEESKVLAANYLAEIGDLQAIEPLEKLSAEWSGDEQDNPYATAIQEIKERLEEDTTTETLVKDTEDLTEANSVTSTVAAVGITGSGSIYDHFLFTRIDKEDANKTKTLVLAKVTPNGFELRELDTGPYDGGGYRWEYPLCVVDGILYCKERKSLVSMDLTTGEIHRIGNLPELSLSYRSYLSTYCYNNGRLYALNGETKTLEVLDFRKRAYRNITTIEECRGIEPIAISPDHKRIALFAYDPNKPFAVSPSAGMIIYEEKPYTGSPLMLLRVVDVESGEISYPLEPFESSGISTSSFRLSESRLVVSPIPLVWLDAQRVLFVLGASSDLPARLVSVNVDTGDINDAAVLPGRPSSPEEVPLVQDNTGAGPIVFKDDDDDERFRLDVAAGKLVEDDCIGGDYYLSDGYLLLDYEELSAVKRHEVKVSPNGRRILWVSDGKLFYNDSAGQTTTAVLVNGAVTGGHSVLWVKGDELKGPAASGQPPERWIAFEDRPPEPHPEPQDEAPPRSPRPPRENINEHLTFKVETDKDIYLLHEPVEITLTVTSISDRDLELVAPVVFNPITGGSIVWLSLHYPNGSSGIDCGAQPYAPEIKNIVLSPGESVSATDILEVPRAAKYRLGCEYRRRGLKGDWQGKLGDSAAFEVKPIDSPEQEREFLEAKFDRLMEKFRYQRSIAPDWDGYQPTVADDIVGIRGMGAKVAPYLIEVLKDESDNEAREVFYRTLTEVAGPETLPYFQDRLTQGTKYEYKRACDWLYNLYRKAGEGSAEALGTLLSAMNHNDADIRDEAGDVLNNIYDPNVEACFESALEDEEKGVRTKAARYLAAAEWLDLNEWLDVAAEKPTKARYIAARSIIGQLEKYWHISKGELPSVSWEEASKDTEKLEQYRKVVQAWQKWASENLRYSSRFFDGDREHWLKERSQ